MVQALGVDQRIRAVISRRGLAEVADGVTYVNGEQVKVKSSEPSGSGASSRRNVR